MLSAAMRSGAVASRQKAALPASGEWSSASTALDDWGCRTGPSALSDLRRLSGTRGCAVACANVESAGEQPR